MKCISPISLLQNGNRVTVPCGKCLPCLSRRRQDWLFRIEAELRKASSAFFITLTYADEHLTVNDQDQGILMKSDLQKFIKRLRWYCDQENKSKGIDRKIRYYCVGEYGSKDERPHYHCIIFNLPTHKDIAIRHRKVMDFVAQAWKYGIVHVGEVNSSSINYTLAYIIIPKVDQDNLTKQFAIMSTKPAIGFNYLSENKDYHLKKYSDVTTKIGGQKVALPRYYRDRIFDKTTRRILRENKIEEMQRRDQEEFNQIISHNSDYGLYDIQKKQELETKRNKSIKNKKL